MIERLKTVCILILLIAGITQVGILWSYQSRGTPTGFLYGLLGIDKSPQISDEIVRERLFAPDRLIISDGSFSYWVVRDNEKKYSALWDEAKQGLYKIISGDAALTRTESAWSDAAMKRGIIIDFGFAMESRLMSWFLGVVDPSHDLADIRKVMINRDITDESISVFYICTGNGTVYASERIRYEGAESMADIISAVSRTSREYTSFGGGRIAKENDEQDVLYVVAPRYWKYSSYTMSSPVAQDDEDELASILLGNKKDRYNISRIRGNIVQFSYSDDVYRYYADGYMTYRYLESADTSGKGQSGKALFNAYQFISEIYNQIRIPTDIALTSVEELSNGVYQFGFDYKIGGLPVRVDIESKDGDGRMKHAIVIQADIKRVLKCDWLLKEFMRGSSGNFDERFNYLLQSSGIDFRNLSIQDIYPCYFVGSPDTELLNPVLMFITKNQGDIPIEMIPEEGD